MMNVIACPDWEKERGMLGIKWIMLAFQNLLNRPFFGGGYIQPISVLKSHFDGIEYGQVGLDSFLDEFFLNTYQVGI